MKSQTSGKATNPSASDMNAARRVFKLAAQGIDELTKSLDGGFIDALDLMAKVTGRVIVSGMGKSGHIANKIAATLASTGTPAFFVHPAEASHGDLGMITRNDLVLAISNSGETLELSDLVAHTQRFDIPLVAITRDKNSLLGENADVVVILPEVDEACPMRLVTLHAGLQTPTADSPAYGHKDRSLNSRRHGHRQQRGQARSSTRQML